MNHNHGETLIRYDQAGLGRTSVIFLTPSPHLILWLNHNFLGVTAGHEPGGALSMAEGEEIEEYVPG
jgi:hypothetical protein